MDILKQSVRYRHSGPLCHYTAEENTVQYSLFGSKMCDLDIEVYNNKNLCAPWSRLMYHNMVTDRLYQIAILEDLLKVPDFAALG